MRKREDRIIFARILSRRSLPSQFQPNRTMFRSRTLVFRNARNKTKCRHFASAKAPTLSRRSRVDLFIVVAGALGSWVYIRSSDWDRDVWETKQRLLVGSTESSSLSGGHPRRSSMEEDLPLPLQTYLSLALNRAHPNDLNVVTVEQSGEFFASQQWYPFSANLLFLAHPHAKEASPGFVWEADVDILKMPNRILESYIQGKGSITTKAWGKIPMIQVEEEEPHVLFWLAMAPLSPVAFRQSIANAVNTDKRSMIVWNSIHDLSSCSGELRDERNGNTFYIELAFDMDTKLLKSIRVTSACLPKPWQVNFKDYHRVNGSFLFPSITEVGKWNGQEFDVHLKILNHRVQAYHQA